MTLPATPPRVEYRRRRRPLRPESRPAFRRQVEVVRRQLAPISDGPALLNSFAREAAYSRAVLVAYALRWTELARSTPAPERRGSTRDGIHPAEIGRWFG